MGVIKHKFNLGGTPLTLTCVQNEQESFSDGLLHIADVENGMLFQQRLADGRNLQALSVMIRGGTPLRLLRYQIGNQPSICTRFDTIRIENERDYRIFDVPEHDPILRSAIKSNGDQLDELIDSSLKYLQTTRYGLLRDGAFALK